MYRADRSPKQSTPTLVCTTRGKPELGEEEAHFLCTRLQFSGFTNVKTGIRTIKRQGEEVSMKLTLRNVSMCLALTLVSGGCSSSVTIEQPETEKTRGRAGGQIGNDSSSDAERRSTEAPKALRSDSRDDDNKGNNQSKVDNPVLSPLNF